MFNPFLDVYYFFFSLTGEGSLQFDEIVPDEFLNHTPMEVTSSMVENVLNDGIVNAEGQSPITYYGNGDYKKKC